MGAPRSTQVHPLAWSNKKLGHFEHMYNFPLVICNFFHQNCLSPYLAQANGKGRILGAQFTYIVVVHTLGVNFQSVVQWKRLKFVGS
jgi:hypothetical protein